MASAAEADRGLLAIDRIKRQLGTDAASKLAAPPEPEPQRPALHDEGCPYCRREACWACEHLGIPLATCRHEKPARHGAGDLTNPEPPESDAGRAVAPEDEAVHDGADAVGGGDGEGEQAPAVRADEESPDQSG